jgi:hypothetical protein
MRAHSELNYSVLLLKIDIHKFINMLVIKWQNPRYLLRPSSPPVKQVGTL